MSETKKNKKVATNKTSTTKKKVKTEESEKKHLPGNTTLEEISRNVHFINHRFLSTSDNFWVLLTSDRHHDNPHCNQELEKKHLDEAKERNAVIIDYGDLFCAMQGKFDRRASKDDIRPEHQHGNYLDKLVATATEFYAPYANNFAVMGPGNHETAMLKHHETNLTERLVERLNMSTGLRYAQVVIAGGLSLNLIMENPKAVQTCGLTVVKNARHQLIFGIIMVMEEMLL